MREIEVAESSRQHSAYKTQGSLPNADTYWIKVKVVNAAPI